MTTSRSFRLEAEDFSSKTGFFDFRAGFASDDGFLMARPWGTGAAETKFQGESGRYKVVVHYFDEKDGASTLKLNIGGESDRFVFDDGRTANSPSSASATSRTSFGDIQIDKDEAIELELKGQGFEFASVDYIEFVRLDNNVKPAAPAAPKAPEAEATPEPDPYAGLDAFEKEVVLLTNEIRKKAGLSILRVDEDLVDTAESHSRDMAENGFFSHVGSDGDGHITRAQEAGYDSRYVGENIAAGHDTPEQVVDAWMRSAGHRANILNPKYEEIGVGFVDDASSRFDQYWTQSFGWEAELA